MATLISQFTTKLVYFLSVLTFSNSSNTHNSSEIALQIEAHKFLIELLSTQMCFRNPGEDPEGIIDVLSQDRSLASSLPKACLENYMTLRPANGAQTALVPAVLCTSPFHKICSPSSFSLEYSIQHS